MADVIGTLLGGFLGVVIVFCLAVIILFWPLMAWSAMRSLKGIHRELQRMNDARPDGVSAGRGPIGL